MLNVDFDRMVGAVVREHDGLILGSFCCLTSRRAITVSHVLEEASRPGDICLYINNKKLNAEDFVVDRSEGTACIAANFSDALHPLPLVGPNVCAVAYIVGWPQFNVSNLNSGLRVLKTHVMRICNPTEFEIQGSFPKGFSGAAVLDRKGRLTGLLDELHIIDIEQAASFCYGLVRTASATWMK